MTLDAAFSGINNQFSHQGHPGGTIGADTTYVFLASKSLGELRLGSMGPASDNGTFLNFGNAVVGGLAGARFVGNFRLRDVGGVLTDVTYGQLLQEWTGNRENRLMYLSPDYSGFRTYSDWGGDDTYSTAFTYVTRFGAVQVEAGAGYEVSSRHRRRHASNAERHLGGIPAAHQRGERYAARIGRIRIDLGHQFRPVRSAANMAVPTQPSRAGRTS